MNAHVGVSKSLVRAPAYSVPHRRGSSLRCFEVSAYPKCAPTVMSTQVMLHIFKTNTAKIFFNVNLNRARRFGLRAPNELALLYALLLDHAPQSLPKYCGDRSMLVVATLRSGNVLSSGAISGHADSTSIQPYQREHYYRSHEQSTNETHDQRVHCWNSRHDASISNTAFKIASIALSVATRAAIAATSDSIKRRADNTSNAPYQPGTSGSSACSQIYTPEPPRTSTTPPNSSARIASRNEARLTF